MFQSQPHWPGLLALIKQINGVAEKENITADRIYNVDESGLIVVQKVSKILAKKGKHQVGPVTSLERGKNVTIICCMSAAGTFVPPGMIFPMRRWNPDLEDGALPKTMFACQVSEYLVVVSLGFRIVILQ